MSSTGLVLLAVQAIGWGLVHFVWQATLVAAGYAMARAVLPRGNPRYMASMLALLALAVLPVCTVWHEVRTLWQPIDLGSVLVTVGSNAAQPMATNQAADWLAPVRVALPWLVLAWACGVVLLGVRMCRQWHGLQAIVRAAEMLPVWQVRASALGERLGLRRAVRVLASVRIATPTLVGWVRPVVVLPLAMLARMPAEQVDLILAHELAHLRRFDHVANLFQVVLETLFFYHPAVHWISRDARNERELCCDVLALRASGGSRRDFVAALAGLEEFRCDHADLVLAASDGVLVERAWFIAGAAPARRRARPSLDIVLYLLCAIAVVLAVAWRQAAVHARLEAIIAMNADALRGELTAGVASVPMPVLRDAIMRRLQLAPVALVREPTESPDDATAISPTVPVVDVPPPIVADLAVARAPPQFTVPTVPDRQGASDIVAAPRLVRAVAPVYPGQALMNGVQGQVEIQFALDGAGVPRDLQVVRSNASGAFDAASLSALSHWRFAPPVDAGRRYRQTFTFRLDATNAGDIAAAAPACLLQTGTRICQPVPRVQPDPHAQRSNP